MYSKNYSTEGVVLARRNYGEADRIVSIYTKHFGRLSYMAKGIRKPTSRKRASLEIFSSVSFLAHKGRSLDLITETQTLETFRSIRKSLSRVALAYFFCEVIGKITREAEKNEELYNLLLKYLNELKTSRRLRTLRHNFSYDVLILLGFLPRGKPPPDMDSVLESVLERGLSSLRVGKKLLKPD